MLFVLPLLVVAAAMMGTALAIDRWSYNPALHVLKLDIMKRLLPLTVLAIFITVIAQGIA